MIFLASFKQLQNETQFLLEELEKSIQKLITQFIDPIATKMSQDTLQAMGMQPSMLPDMKDGNVSKLCFFLTQRLNIKVTELLFRSLPIKWE